VIWFQMKEKYDNFIPMHPCISSCFCITNENMLPTQHFNVTPHSAKCFGSHELSSGTYFYNSFRIRAWWRFMWTEACDTVWCDIKVLCWMSYIHLFMKEKCILWILNTSKIVAVYSGNGIVYSSWSNMVHDCKRIVRHTSVTLNMTHHCVTSL
jgi:hypothetical protein